jgi:NAD(P)-dependent dehydrogenase (short-subunit alcohol dehydrogenase family)
VDSKYSLAGKVAIITGASRGNGKNTAAKLAQHGADVFLTSNEPISIMQVALDKCHEANPKARVEWANIDLGDPDGPQRMVDAALEKFGRVDVLVNNLGIRCNHPFGEYSVEEFDRMIAVNLRAAFLGSQAVLPAMRKQGGGRIIHVASQIGLVAHKQSVLYGLTKAALIYMARGMAFELAKEHILVNTISPGVIMSEVNVERLKHNPEIQAERLAYIPAGRYGEPDEIAEAILYLASAAPAYLQGHNLVVDGGYVIH